MTTNMHDYVIAHLQMFLLERCYEVPYRMREPEFLENLIKYYLQKNIELSSLQKEELFDRLILALAYFKEIYRKERNTTVLKDYLDAEVDEIVFDIISLRNGEE